MTKQEKAELASLKLEELKVKNHLFAAIDKIILKIIL